jgi:hypothetical protein
MGDPTPRSARSVLHAGETRRFVVFEIDGPSRSIDLALVVDATPAAGGDDESRAAGKPAKSRTSAARSRKDGGATKADHVEDMGEAESQIVGEEDVRTHTGASSLATTSSGDTHAEEAPVTPVKKTVRKSAKKSAPKRPAKKTARKTTAKKAAKRTTKKTTAKKAAKRPAKKAARKTTAKKAAKRTTKKTTAKKAAKRPAKKATAKKAAKRPAKKAAKRTTKKTTAKKAARRR